MHEFPGPHSASCRTGSPLTSLKVDQKAKFVPRRMSAESVDEAQCDPQAVESVREGKEQLLFISPESHLLVCAVP